MPKSPVMVASGKFVATPMEGRIRLAGIVEFGGLDAPPSRAPFELMRKNARTVFPGITWKDEVEWMGHRPAPGGFNPGDRRGPRNGRCLHGLWAPPYRPDRRAQNRTPFGADDRRQNTEYRR